MKLVSGTFTNLIEVAGAALVVLAVFLAFLWPRLGSVRFRVLERWLTGIARRKSLAIVIAGLLPILLRVALLPVYPPPEPWTHDEFCHLLQADTFASGRITNPPHKHWEHFESIYILSQPTYTAKYQPSQGLFLAAGKLAGSEWAAVVASMGILCALLCWMLQGWLPPPWAFLGACMAALQFGVLSYWMNSYWGGTIPAIGGTLVLGALPRLLTTTSLSYGLIVGVGLAVTVNDRPLEALLLGLVVGAVAVHRVFQTRELPFWSFVRIWLLPVFAVLLPCFAAMAWYNQSVTGNALKLPYALHVEQYGTPQGFFWQAPFDVASFRHPEIRDEYLHQRKLHARRSSPLALATATLGRVRAWWLFYVGSTLTILLLFLPWAARHPDVRFTLLALAVFTLCHLTFHAYYPHYAAPIIGFFWIVLLHCWRRLRAWRWQGQPAGRAIARALPIVSLILLAIPVVGRVLEPALPPSLQPLKRLWATEFSSLTQREAFVRQLRSLGGQHLVFVRYQPGHDPDHEWVYNSADIDRADVVWARLWTEESNSDLRRYFRGRRVWIAEPDAQPSRLTEDKDAEKAALSR